MLSVVLGGKKRPLKFIIPFLNKYVKEREFMEHNVVSSHHKILLTIKSHGSCLVDSC